MILISLSRASGAVFWRSGVSGMRASVRSFVFWSVEGLELWGGRQELCARLSVPGGTGSGRWGSMCARRHVSLHAQRHTSPRWKHHTEELQQLVCVWSLVFNKISSQYNIGLCVIEEIQKWTFCHYIASCGFQTVEERKYEMKMHICSQFKLIQTDIYLGYLFFTLRAIRRCGERTVCEMKQEWLFL